VHGLAHSVEVWQQGQLVGGLYGVSMGGAFFGESMFSHVANASKVALVQLCEHLMRLGVELIDCQVETEHLLRMGAETLSRDQFLARLALLREHPVCRGSWDDGKLHAPGTVESLSQPLSGSDAEEESMPSI
jgi:leucyl/phenylalanyl-tRNA--protein transferase